MTALSANLPSNDSLGDFLTDISSDFKVTIPTWLEMEGDLEVGLTRSATLFLFFFFNEASKKTKFMSDSAVVMLHF